MDKMEKEQQLPDLTIETPVITEEEPKSNPDQVQSPEKDEKKQQEEELRKKKEQRAKKLHEEKIMTSCFSIIVEFVNQLYLQFGNKTKVTPLGLYKKIIENLKISDKEFIGRVINGFREFFKRNEQSLETGNLFLIQKGEKIYYSETIFIEIQKFIHKSRNDAETLETISEYLKLIDTTLNPTNEKFNNLEKSVESSVDTSTDEGKFISDILVKTKDSVSGDDMKNPLTAITGIVQSGVLTTLWEGISGSGKKGLDPQKLLGSLQGALGVISGGDEKGVEKLFGSIEKESHKATKKRK